MAIKKLNPYLAFDGTADKAIKLYESALGAQTETVSRFGDVPGSDTPPEHKNRVMHAVLRIGEGVIMISDGPPGKPVAVEGNVHITLDFDDPAELTQRFDALAKGGKITMPVQDTFWGAKFGMLTDAYGIQWMLNCDLKKR
jgi:PhnB protein